MAHNVRAHVERLVRPSWKVPDGIVTSNAGSATRSVQRADSSPNHAGWNGTSIAGASARRGHDEVEGRGSGLFVFRTDQVDFVRIERFRAGASAGPCHRKRRGIRVGGTLTVAVTETLFVVKTVREARRSSVIAAACEASAINRYFHDGRVRDRHDRYRIDARQNRRGPTGEPSSVQAVALKRVSPFTLKPGSRDGCLLAFCRGDEPPRVRAVGFDGDRTARRNDGRPHQLAARIRYR